MSTRTERAANARHRRHAAGTRTPDPTPSPATSYLPGLDGLRALAVVAVLVFHARTDWLPGGFLGVDVFFVVSGFIITRGLLAEWDARGRIDAPAFWVRRARRLLPALALVLVAALAYCAFEDPDRVARLRADSLASLFYVTNWYLVIGNQSYFAAIAPPSLLRHLWSLAVEEQFYVAWPFVLTAGLALVGRRRLPAVLVLLALATTVEMALLYHAGASVSRLYYGTDTHLSGLLAGAALAVPLTGRALSPAQSRGAPLLDAAGVLALAFILYLTFSVDDQGMLLYNGGFAAVAVASCVLVVAAIHPASLLSRVLERPPLRWLGRRSYGIYLWHWPIFVLMPPSHPASLAGIGLLALEASGAIAIAALSYRLVEEPIRHGGLRRAWRWFFARRPRGRVAMGAGLAAASAGAIAALVLVVRIPGPETPPYFATSHVHLERDSVADAVVGPSPGDVPVIVQHSAALLPEPAYDPLGLEIAGGRTTPTSPAASTPPRAPLRAGATLPAVTAIGDSVMLGAARQLVDAAPHVTVDAEVGRPVSAALAIMRKAVADRTLAPVVVLDIGNNGTFTDSEFNEAMRIAGSSRRVIWVNLKEPRAWEPANNDVIARGVARYPNAELADWHAASVSRPELFYSDLIHLRPEGAAVYVALIASHFR